MNNPPLEKLVALITNSWNQRAASLLGQQTELEAREFHELRGDSLSDEFGSALDSAILFSTQGSGTAEGLLIFVITKADAKSLEQNLIQKGVRLSGLLGEVLTGTATELNNEAGFGEVVPVDMAPPGILVRERLIAACSDNAWLSKLALTVGENLNTEIKLFYMPNGSLEALLPAERAGAGEFAMAASANAPAGGFSSPKPDPARNIERILDVELEVVVRFGLTHMPLKELVRVGVGSMIELNRQVDEPVELLVNDRVLARGSVVVVDGYYGVCINEIGLPEERRLSLAKHQ